MIYYIKRLLVFLILSKRERSVIYSCLKTNEYYAIESYSEAMGETYREFIQAIDSVSWMFKPVDYRPMIINNQ